jgi:hypothetical protein
MTAAAAAVFLVASCADLPSTGPVQSTPAPQGRSGTTCCALVMSGPQRGASPTDIVSGFLLASASFAHHNAIAREYLTPAASKSWAPGSAVTIVDEAPTVIVQPRHFGPENTVMVVASGQVIATLSPSGQYQPVAGSKVTAQQKNFVVERYHGEYRIARLPGAGRVSHLLMLPDSLFNLVYKPQNLYFYARGSRGRVLVPDPVFVPSDSSDPATRLVRALMNGVPEWLDGAAVTAFPAQARLLGVTVLPGAPGNKTAIVSLALPRRAVNPATLRALDAQLVWTLTSSSYGQPLIQSVKLKVNGRYWPASGAAVLSQASYRAYVPGPAAAESLYYVGSDGRVRVLRGAVHGNRARATPLPGAAGQGRIPMKVIAVSPDQRYLAGIGGSGTTVYVSDLAAASAPHAGTAATAPHARLRGAGFTALSWDRWDALWAAGQVGRSAGVWVLPHGHGPAVRVSLPPGLGRVTALRIAPDGVRAAMIASRGGTSRLLIGAVIRAGGQFVILHTLRAGPNLADPVELTWYDPDHLLVVTGTGQSTQVSEVPVNGNGAVRQGTAQPGIVAAAAAGSHNPLYLGLAGGRLERSAGFGGFWSDVTGGSAPAYPG